MPSPSRIVAATVLATLLPLAACGSGKKSAKPAASSGTTTTTAAPGAGGTTTTAKGSSATTTSGGAAGGTPGAGGPGVVAQAPDGNTYEIKVTAGAPNAKPAPPCAVAAQNGRQTVPFTLTIVNQEGKDVPQPAIGLLIDDPQKGASEVVAMSVDNNCIDFTLTGDTIKAGGSVSYQGSASNVSNQAKLIVNMKAGTIGTSGATQQEFALFK